MNVHWTDVRESMEVLTSIILKFKADDRIDVELAMGDKKHDSSRTKSIVSYIRDNRPGTGQNGADASIESAISRVLQKFIADHEHQRNSRIGRLRGGKKPLSLYILTNGVFPEHDHVEAPIKDAVEKMKRLGLEPDTIGLQFVRFGDDPGGIEKLRKVDDFEETRWDIVDTEKWDGNILKILLGPINRTFDYGQTQPTSMSPVGPYPRSMGSP